MTRKALAGFPLILTLLLAACRQAPAPPPVPTPVGRKLSALPTAVGAPVFAPAGGHYTEALLQDGTWQIHAEGKPVASAATEEELATVLKSAKERAIIEGYQPVLLISADAGTPFEQFFVPVRVAAASGFMYFHFLVLSSEPGVDKAISHALPMVLSYPARSNKSKPFFIQITANGEIAVGSGASYQVLDSATAGTDLPGLEAQLSLYASAARVANSNPIAAVYVAPTVPYQRFIDLLSRFHANGVRPYLTHLSPHDETDPSDSPPPRKPSSPESHRATPRPPSP